MVGRYELCILNVISGILNGSCDVYVQINDKMASVLTEIAAMDLDLTILRVHHARHLM